MSRLSRSELFGVGSPVELVKSEGATGRVPYVRERKGWIISTLGGAILHLAAVFFVMLATGSFFLACSAARWLSHPKPFHQIKVSKVPFKICNRHAELDNILRGSSPFQGMVRHVDGGDPRLDAQ